MHNSYTRHADGMDILNVHSPIIGRVNDIADAPCPSDSSHQEITLKKSSCFSQTSRLSAMSSNLSLGISYLERQKASLLDINDLLLSLNKRKTDRYKNGHMLYLNLLRSILERKFGNLSLFGCGTELPIRLHLNRDGKPFICEVPILPLWTDPFIQALAYSSSCIEPPSPSMVSAASASTLEFLIQNSTHLCSLQELLEELKKKSVSAGRCFSTDQHQEPSSFRRRKVSLNWRNRFLSFLNRDHAFS